MNTNNIDIIAEQSPLYIELVLKFCGFHEKLPKGNIFGDIISGDYIFQYCTRGKGEFVVDGNSFRIKTGDCMITFPGQTRREKADDINPWGLMWIGINGKSAENVIKKLGVSTKNPIIKNLEHTEIPVIMKSAIDIAESIGFERDFLLSQRLFTFFDKITELICNSTKDSPDMTDSYVNQATYFLDIHYSDKNLSIQSLANNIGLNRSYLYKIFKEKTGLSPQEYLTQIRIKNALEFMSFPRATVTTVANSVGYEPSVFSKAFKKAVGITPKEYINKKF